MRLSVSRISIAFQVELVKTFRQKSSYIGPLFIIGLIIGLTIARPFQRDAVSDYDIISTITPLALNILGLFFIIITGASLISWELGTGSIRSVLTRPILRHEYFLAKLLVGIAYIIVLDLIVAIGLWSALFILGDAIGVTYGGELIYTNVDMMGSYFTGLALGLFPQIATLAFAMFFSTLTRNMLMAILASIGSWVAVDLIKYPLHIAPFIFSCYLETPWRVFTDNANGLTSAWYPDAVYCMITSLVFFTVFTGAALYLFSKRSIRA